MLQDNKPLLEQLTVNGLCAVLKLLPKSGYLAQSPDGLIYLDIDDDYINQIYPLLQQAKVAKPDYFKGEHALGAHITLAYPDEISTLGLFADELGQHYSFTAGNLFSTYIHGKKYYALAVVAPSLLALRKQYGLPEYLNFKQHWIGLHITIAVR